MEAVSSQHQPVGYNYFSMLSKEGITISVNGNLGGNDPLSGVANLFDIWLVFFGVAFHPVYCLSSAKSFQRKIRNSHHKEKQEFQTLWRRKKSHLLSCSGYSKTIYEFIKLEIITPKGI